MVSPVKNTFSPSIIAGSSITTIDRGKCSISLNQPFARVVVNYSGSSSINICDVSDFSEIQYFSRVITSSGQNAYFITFYDDQNTSLSVLRCSGVSGIGFISFNVSARGLTEIVIASGSTIYTWGDIYSPITTQIDLKTFSDMSVFTFSNRDSHPDNWCPVYSRVLDSGTSTYKYGVRFFPISSSKGSLLHGIYLADLVTYPSQTYILEQTVRYADLAGTYTFIVDHPVDM